MFGFVGEFEWDVFDTYALRALVCLFIFIVVIVLLNVLIAIVGESYEKAREDKTRVGIYYRLKIELITDMNPVANPFGLQKEEKPREIAKRLTKALEKHKEEVDEDDTDATRLAAIRNSEERTNKKLAEMEKKIDELKTLLQENL